jgi:hypothetical protein
MNIKNDMPAFGTPSIEISSMEVFDLFQMRFWTPCYGSALDF